jgi:small subunit ribosomal protein S4
MGSIKRFTNKYETPGHPWRKERIETERALRKQYGLKNSRELWKVISKLTNFKDQVKNFATMAPAQGAKEREQLQARLAKFGLMPEDGNMETVLGYTPDVLLERRLQTIVLKRGYAHTMRQARQFITHRHVLVGEKCVTAPGYLVPLSEEAKITFKVTSSLVDDQHPERLSREDAKAKRDAEKEAKRRLEEEKAKEVEAEVVELTEEDVVVE